MIVILNVLNKKLKLFLVCMNIKIIVNNNTQEEI